MNPQELLALKQLSDDKFSDENRGAIEDKKRVSTFSRIMAGIADTLGGATGQGLVHTPNVINAGQRRREEELGKFDDSKKQAVSEYLMKKAQFDKATQLADNRAYQEKVTQGDRDFQSGQKSEDREFRSSESAASRAHDLDKQRRGQEFQGFENQKQVAAKAQVDQEKDKKLYVPGAGYAFTPDDAKQLKAANEVKGNFDTKLDEMIALRGEKGAEVFNRNKVVRGKQLAKQLLIDYKDLAKLGILSESDMKLINEIIPEDPLEFDASSLVGQDPTMTKLKMLKEDMQKRYESSLRSRIDIRDEDPSEGIREEDIDNMSIEELTAAGLI